MTDVAKTAKGLSTREEVFVRALLGEAQGNHQAAARMAGYRNPEKAAFRLMRRERVTAAIQAEMQEVAPYPDGPTKQKLLDLLWGITVSRHENPFARVKAGAEVAKILGWYAPAHRINENITGEVPGSYKALLETLQNTVAGFAPDQKSALREKLLEELGAIQESLTLLSEGTSH